MTRDEADKAIQQAEQHAYGVKVLALPWDCPGGYALFSPAEGMSEVGYLVTEYDVNLFEPLQAIGYAPELTVSPVTVMLVAFRAWLLTQGFDICELDGTGYATTVEDSIVDALLRRYEQEVSG